MRVHCISEKGELLPKEYIDQRANVTKETDFRITRGKDYLVYALAIRGSQVWYYLIDDCELWYPINIPAPLFTIVDDRVSQFWTVKLTPGNPDHDVLLAFEEWDAKDLFYNRLTDRCPSEVSLFQTRRLRMDQEFREAEKA